MPAKIDGLTEAKKIAKNKGGKCLSKEYVNIRTGLEFECKNNHTWFARLYGARKGHWCQKCVGLGKLSIEIAQELAKNKGGECLSKNYVNSYTLMKWKCGRGHIWEADLDTIKNGGHWCKKCADIEKLLGLEHCQEVADKLNGKCLSKKYVDNKTFMKWECEDGHIWENCVNEIKNGHWCPDCSFGKSQRKLGEIIEKIVGENPISNHRGFDWLKNPNTGNNLEIDLWFQNNKLAVEYDGMQHFMPVCFGGILYEEAEENFKIRKKLDKIKNKLIGKNKQIKCFIRIRYNEPLNEKYIKEKLIKAGIKC